MFGRHDAIWLGAPPGPPESLALDDLVGGIEFVNGVGGDRIEVTAKAVREVLQTGLFSSRGGPQAGWAHQTYAEFLAAQYLVAKGVSPDRMLSFVMHPNDPDRVAPQLLETAAWLAGMIPDVFMEIAKRDPYVLLFSDVATADQTGRRQLVEQLLLGFDQRRLLDADWGVRKFYRKLAQEGIGDCVGCPISGGEANSKS